MLNPTTTSCTTLNASIIRAKKYLTMTVAFYFLKIMKCLNIARDTLN